MDKQTIEIGTPVPELPVADVEISQKYFRDKLGFEIGWIYPGKEIGAVSRTNAVLFLRRKVPPFEPVAVWIHVEEIEHAFQEFTSSGANIAEPLEKKPWGLQQFTVTDLDGNLFYFFCD